MSRFTFLALLVVLVLVQAGCTFKSGSRLDPPTVEPPTPRSVVVAPSLVISLSPASISRTVAHGDRSDEHVDLEISEGAWKKIQDLQDEWEELGGGTCPKNAAWCRPEFKEKVRIVCAGDSDCLEAMRLIMEEISFNISVKAPEPGPLEGLLVATLDKCKIERAKYEKDDLTETQRKCVVDFADGLRQVGDAITERCRTATDPEDCRRRAPAALDRMVESQEQCTTDRCRENLSVFFKDTSNSFDGTGSLFVLAASSRARCGLDAECQGDYQKNLGMLVSTLKVCERITSPLAPLGKCKADAQRNFTNDPRSFKQVCSFFLPNITDPEALRFENGASQWENVDSDLLNSVDQFIQAMRSEGVALHRASGYRPLEYQRHFFEIRNLKARLITLPEAVRSECQYLAQVVDWEIITKHSLNTNSQGIPTVSQPRNSKHTINPAEAVDIGPRATLQQYGFNEINERARQFGVFRPCGTNDIVHFSLEGVSC